MIEITYSEFWNDCSHNGGLILDLEKFITTTLKMGKTIQFKIEKDT